MQSYLGIRGLAGCWIIIATCTCAADEPTRASCRHSIQSTRTLKPPCDREPSHLALCANGNRAVVVSGTKQPRVTVFDVGAGTPIFSQSVAKNVRLVKSTEDGSSFVLVHENSLSIWQQGMESLFVIDGLAPTPRPVLASNILAVAEHDGVQIWTLDNLTMGSVIRAGKTRPLTFLDGRSTLVVGTGEDSFSIYRVHKDGTHQLIETSDTILGSSPLFRGGVLAEQIA